jgi:hypothetical protein
MRTCKQCGSTIPIQKGRHRPRIYCTTCRPPRKAQPAGELVVGTFGGVRGETSLLAATERKLVEAGRRDEPAAVLVLNLARSIDAGGHSGASLASLSREFSRALADALPPAASKAADDIDWDVG